MKITKEQLKQIIKEELSEVYAGGDYGNVKDRQSDNYHAVRMELVHGMDIPKEDVTDELIMAILRDPRYSDGDSIDARASTGAFGASGYGFTRQDIYNLKRKAELREVDMGGEPTGREIKSMNDKRRQEKIEELAEKALWYYRNQRGGGLKDLKIIAFGQPMPDVVRISQEEAMHIVVVAEALKKAGVKNDLQEESAFHGNGPLAEPALEEAEKTRKPSTQADTDRMDRQRRGVDGPEYKDVMTKQQLRALNKKNQPKKQKK